MQTCWVLGNVLVNAEDRHDAHGRCRVSEDERPESTTWGGVAYCAALASRGSAAGSDCYLKETEDELSACHVPEGQGELVGNRRCMMGRDARTNTAQLYTLMELKLPQLLWPDQLAEGRL